MVSPKALVEGLNIWFVQRAKSSYRGRFTIAHFFGFVNSKANLGEKLTLSDHHDRVSAL